MKSVGNLLVVLVLGFFLACGSEKANRKTGQENSAQKDLIKVHLDFDLRAGTPPHLVQIHSALKTGVSFNRLTELWVEMHRNEFNQRHSDDFIGPAEASNYLKAISENLDASNPLRFRKDYEAAVLAHTEHTEIHYNLEAVSIFDLPHSGELQCYSGTVLDQVLNRNVKGVRDFLQSHHVVIFEPGHILPGRMFPVKDKAWRMEGYETTTEDPLVDYGPVASFVKKRLKLKVVDATFFVVIELFKNYLANANEVVRQALLKTAVRYGIPLPLQLGEAERKGKSEGKNALNSSPFGFGKIEVEPGRRTRGQRRTPETYPSPGRIVGGDDARKPSQPKKEKEITEEAELIRILVARKADDPASVKAAYRAANRLGSIGTDASYYALMGAIFDNNADAFGGIIAVSRSALTEIGNRGFGQEFVKRFRHRLRGKDEKAYELISLMDGGWYGERDWVRGFTAHEFLRQIALHKEMKIYADGSDRVIGKYVVAPEDRIVAVHQLGLIVKHRRENEKKVEDVTLHILLRFLENLAQPAPVPRRGRTIGETALEALSLADPHHLLDGKTSLGDQILKKLPRQALHSYHAIYAIADIPFPALHEYLLEGFKVTNREIDPVPFIFHRRGLWHVMAEVQLENPERAVELLKKDRKEFFDGKFVDKWGFDRFGVHDLTILDKAIQAQEGR